MHKPPLWTVRGQVRSALYPTASIRIIAGGGATWQIDELRMASTWDAAIPTASIGR
ncbi:MAG: hypothetical protein AAGD07_09075 [Planctomycetota bacterium]